MNRAAWICTSALTIGLHAGVPVSNADEASRDWTYSGFRPQGDNQFGRAYREQMELEEARERVPLFWPTANPPLLPGDDTVERNIEQVKAIPHIEERLDYWVGAVQDEWNYKTHAGGWRKWQDAGNFNFGATGMDAVPDIAFKLGNRTFEVLDRREMLLLGAGAFQIFTNLKANYNIIFSNDVMNTSLRPLCGGGVYCDNDDDTSAIVQGMDWAMGRKISRALNGDWGLPTFEKTGKFDAPPFRYKSDIFGELGDTSEKSHHFDEEAKRYGEIDELATEQQQKDVERARDKFIREELDRAYHVPIATTSGTQIHMP